LPVDSLDKISAAANVPVYGFSSLSIRRPHPAGYVFVKLVGLKVTGDNVEAPHSGCSLREISSEIFVSNITLHAFLIPSLL